MDQVSEFLSKSLFMIGDAPVTVAQVLSVPMILLVGLLLARWLEKRLTRALRNRDIDDNLTLVLRRGFYIVAITILFLMVMGMLNIPLGAFTFVSGAVAIGVGFGAQNIINNFISGWILMGERPIRIGDLVDINDMLGRVESINTRSTRIRRVDGVRIVMPNSALLENTVINWTLVDNEVRIVVRVGVAYGSDERLVESLILQAVLEQPDTLKEPEPNVLFEDFGDNALIFDVYFWTMLRPGGDHRRLRSEVRFRISELFRENNITISFPQRDVHLDGSITLLDAKSEPAVSPEQPDLNR